MPYHSTDDPNAESASSVTQSSRSVGAATGPSVAEIAKLHPGTGTLAGGHRSRCRLYSGRRRRDHHRPRAGGAWPRTYTHVHTLEALRSGAMSVVRLDDLEGLITFPSFHTANAILFAWALWPVRYLRLPVLAL